MADQSTNPKPRVPTTFSVGLDGKLDMRRNFEDTRDYPEGVTKETLAVTAQTKLRGTVTNKPVVPSISIATTFEIKDLDDYMKYIRVGLTVSAVSSVD